VTLVRTQAFLLRKRDYSDTSLIVVFFTLDFGKIQFIIKGAKNKKGSFFGSFEHCSCYEISFQQRHGHHGLILLRDARLIESFSQIRGDLDRFYYASYCMELLDAFMELEDSDPALFNFVFESFNRMRHEKDLELWTRSFEIELLNHLGFFGNFAFCSSCQAPFQENIYLDQRSTRLFCPSCSKKEYVPYRWDHLKWLSDLQKRSTSEIPQDARSEIKKLLWFYIDFHLGKPLKSRKFISPGVK
jgi:DNA repair protein RecO (recombination protein O)